MKNLIGVISALILLSGCSDVQFSQVTSKSNGGNNQTGVPTNSCRDILPTYSGNLRISFMVDSSGSTKTTDPNKYYRATTLDNFIAAYGSKTNLAYSYGIFSGSGSIYNIMTNSFSTTLNVPFGNSVDLASAVSLYKSSQIASDGTTNYIQAFKALQGNILNDIATAGSPKAFSVVFMSDGQPKDLSGSINDGIVSLVSNLKQAVTNQGGAVRVSAVYFGPNNDLQSKEHLKVMATAGNGQFIDTNVLAGNLLNIDDAISIPGQPCGQ